MKLENEITVLVNDNYDNLHNKLLSYGFTIKETYELNDEYMLDTKIDISNMNTLDILKNCVLVRDVVGITKDLVYKYKKYDEFENIIEQGRIKCPITDIASAIKFMEAINYKKIISIKDKIIVYSNDVDELSVQLVNDKYIFIEMELVCNHINKKYKSIKDLKSTLNKYDLNHDKNDYFVKKAKIIYEETI